MRALGEVSVEESRMDEGGWQVSQKQRDGSSHDAIKARIQRLVQKVIHLVPSFMCMLSYVKTVFVQSDIHRLLWISQF